MKTKIYSKTNENFPKTKEVREKILKKVLEKVYEKRRKRHPVTKRCLLLLLRFSSAV